MVFSYIVRWSALTSILSGVLFMVLTTLDQFSLAANHFPPYQIYNPTLYVVEALLRCTGLLLCAVVLAGLHAHQAEYGGILGRIGLSLALITATATVMAIVANIVFPGDTDPGYFSQVGATLILLISMLPLSIAPLRTRVLPRWSAYLPFFILVLGFLMLYINPDVDPVYNDLKGLLRFTCAILFGLGWVLLGYTFWLKKVSAPIQLPSAGRQVSG